MVASNCKTEMLLEKGSIRTFAFDTYPPHVNADNTFAWKPILLDTVLEETPSSADLVFTEPGKLLPHTVGTHQYLLSSVMSIVACESRPDQCMRLVFSMFASKQLEDIHSQLD